jgi:hypothetical protein
MEKHCKELDARVHAAVLRSEEAQLLMRIPGIGEVMALGIVGSLCPIERFPNVDRLSSYVGLCPTTHQSSGTLYHGHLKPDVSRRLRSLLVGASWRHRIHDPKGEVARYARKIGRRKGKMRGSVAGAHKFLRIIYAILKQRRPYLPHAPERPVSQQGLRAPLRRSAVSVRMRRGPLGPPAAGRKPRRSVHVRLRSGTRQPSKGGVG